MGKFTKIPQNTFQDLQVDAGVLLKRFDPDNPVEPSEGDFVCATTGGINPTCTPTYSDWGEDVDNCPNNTKELKHLDGWDCAIATTCLGTSPEAIRLALGAADMTEAVYTASTDTTVQTGKTYYTRYGTTGNYSYRVVTNPTGNPSTNNYYERTSGGDHVTPRATLDQGDFLDELWWVGDKANGGMVAICLKNALSTGGFSLQTTKRAKGQIALTITGHVSINDQDTVPMDFYSTDGE